jgi:hypothetical protein
MDSRGFAIVAMAITGSAVLSYLIRDVPYGVLQNLLAVLFFRRPHGGPVLLPRCKTGRSRMTFSPSVQ